MSYDFINTTLTDAVLSGSTTIVNATIAAATLTAPTLTTPTLTSPVITGATSISAYGITYQWANAPSGSATTRSGLTAMISGSIGVGGASITSSGGVVGTKMYFVNGLLVSSSV